MTQRLSVPLAAVLVAVGVAACGSSGASSSGTSSGSSSRAAAGGGYGAGAYGARTATSSTSSAAAPTTAGAAPAGGAVASAADPGGGLKFVEHTLTAKAGTVKIDFTNRSSVQHNFTLQKGTNGPIVGATPTFSGGLKTLTVKLAPGTYTFFCSLHRMAGMEGTLTVQ